MNFLEFLDENKEELNEGVDIIQQNFSNLINKFVNDIEKNIKKKFSKAIEDVYIEVASISDLELSISMVNTEFGKQAKFEKDIKSMLIKDGWKFSHRTEGGGYGPDCDQLNFFYKKSKLNW